MLKIQIVENPASLPSVSISVMGGTFADMVSRQPTTGFSQSIIIMTPRITEVTMPVLNNIIKSSSLRLIPHMTVVEVQTGITFINFGIDENYDLVDIPIRQIFGGYNFHNPFQNVPPIYDPFGQRPVVSFQPPHQTHLIPPAPYAQRLADYIASHPGGVPAGIQTPIKDGASIKQRTKMINYVRSVLGEPNLSEEEVESVIGRLQTL